MSGRDDKKLNILQKGLEIMYEKGYNATGIQEIVDSAGIPKGSFYNYFESKEDFALQLIKYYSDNNHTMLLGILEDQKLSPIQRIKKLYSMLAKYFTQKDFRMGCFNLNLCQEMADVNEKISHSLKNSLEHLKEPLTQCLKEAQETGEINPSQDIEILSEFIYNSWGGAILRMKASRNADPLNAFLNILDHLLLK